MEEPSEDGRNRLFPGTPVMEFTDRTLQCADCGAEFIFTAGEQFFFWDKQFRNDPKRCKQCKAKRARGGERVRLRPETRTTCSSCGQETTVPFKPTQGRPVLCRICFQQQGMPGVKPAQSTAADAIAPNLAEAVAPNLVESAAPDLDEAVLPNLDESGEMA